MAKRQMPEQLDDLRIIPRFELGRAPDQLIRDQLGKRLQPAGDEPLQMPPVGNRLQIKQLADMRATLKLADDQAGRMTDVLRRVIPCRSLPDDIDNGLDTTFQHRLIQGFLVLVIVVERCLIHPGRHRDFANPCATQAMPREQQLGSIKNLAISKRRPLRQSSSTG